MTLLVSVPVGWEGRVDIHKACLAQEIIPNLWVVLVAAVKVTSYKDRVFIKREDGLKNSVNNCCCWAANRLKQAIFGRLGRRHRQQRHSGQRGFFGYKCPNQEAQV